MRLAKSTARVGAVVVLMVGVQPSSAYHNSTHDQNPSPAAVLGPTDIIHFDAGSLIIPMDGCYQRPTFMSNADVASTILPTTTALAKCATNAEKDDGLIPAYSLVFRLIAAGIPVSWSIKDAKTSFNGIDFQVVRAGGGPVRHHPPGGSDTDKYSTITTVRYRGAPFVIDSSHAAAARLAMTSFAATYSDYTKVDVHVAQVGFDVPVYRTVESLPKLAVIDASDAATALLQEKTSFLSGSIDEAVMADLEGSLFEWVTIPEVLADELIDGDFDLAWVPPFDLPASPTARQIAFMNKLSEFADQGGSILLQDGAIAAAEGYGTMNAAKTVYTATQPTTAGFLSNGGLMANGVSSTWDNGNASEKVKSSDYSDPASQFGGIVWTGIGGSKYNWQVRHDRAYLPGVRRMIYSDDAGSVPYSAKDNWDFAAWRRKDNDPLKGTIYYLGGFHWRRVTAAGFRVLLNTLLATVAGEQEEPTEVSRSAPIVTTVGGIETQYIGTFEAQFPPESAPTYASSADATTFQFPHVVGHLRGLDLADLDQGTTTFEDAGDAVLFDAAEHIPAIDYDGGCGFPADGTCRLIFTETGSATEPTRTQIVLTQVDVLQPLLGSSLSEDDANTLIARIHAGVLDDGDYVARLGGIDRSTVAVIEPSSLIPNGRPTMGYVGGLDGMLHAICLEVVANICPAIGTELWAFMPSTELPKVKGNTARIDGSAKVADVFGDFTGGRAMRTILTFQTGNQNDSAAYALDITDPSQPSIVWRLDTAGPGINTAMGWVRQASSIEPITFLQFASGTETAGFHVVAVNTATGAVKWDYAHDYPAPRTDGNPTVPETSMPGGVSLLTSSGGATVESVLVPSLWGAVYKLDARTGVNEYGSDPLFKFDEEDFHPIGASVAVYRNQDDNELRGLIVTGGFADPFAPTGSVWAPDDVNQYAVGFPLEPDGDAAPVTFEQVSADSTLGLVIDFGEGQRAFSPAVVAGDEVFITTDTSDVNSADFGSGEEDTGRLWQQNLSGGSATFVEIPSGAASVDVSMESGLVMTGGGGGVQRTEPASFDRSGTSVEATPETVAMRRLWLRLR